MISFKTLAAGSAIAGSLGLAALGLGTGVANAAPPNPGSGWAQDRGWDHGPGGPDWNGGGRDWNGGGPGWNGGGPNWGPPPPPPPNYGYGGYDNYGGGGCVTGPLGLLHFCT